jgi:hypothetical protein
MDEPIVTTAAVHDAHFRKTAIECWTDDDLEIDEEATVSSSEDGAWVQAWVWVSNDDAGIDVPETEIAKAYRLKEASFEPV